MKSYAKECHPRAEFQSRSSAAREVGAKCARFSVYLHIGSLSKNPGVQVDPNKLSWLSVTNTT